MDRCNETLFENKTKPPKKNCSSFPFHLKDISPYSSRRISGNSADRSLVRKNRSVIVRQAKIKKKIQKNFRRIWRRRADGQPRGRRQPPAWNVVKMTSLVSVCVCVCVCVGFFLILGFSLSLLAGAVELRVDRVASVPSLSPDRVRCLSFDIFRSVSYSAVLCVCVCVLASSFGIQPNQVGGNRAPTANETKKKEITTGR